MPTPICVDATGLPLTVPSTGDYIREAPFSVPSSGMAEDMHLSLWLQMPDVYFLWVELLPPAGPSISAFWTRAHGADVGGGASQSQRVHIYDAASGDAQDAFTPGAAGNYRPDDNFATSLGASTARLGTWQIRVHNLADSGEPDAVLRAATLCFGMVPSDASDVPVRIRSSRGWIDLTDSAGGDKTYVHTQGTGAAVWTVAHGLNKYPSVMVADNSGSVLMPDVLYLDANSVRVTFGAPVAGKAYVN